MMLGTSVAITQPNLTKADGGAPPAPPALDILHEFDFGSVGSASISQAVTIPAGEYRILFVGVTWVDVSGVGESLTAITYDGVAMTLVPGTLLTSGTATSGLYRLVAPATGNKTLAITFSNVVNAAVGLVAFEGAHQSTPLGTAATATGSSTTPSTSVAAPAGTSFVIDLCGVDVANTTSNPTVGAGQTQNYNRLAGSTPNRVRSSGSYRIDGSGAMARTLSISRPWTIAAVEVKAA